MNMVNNMKTLNFTQGSPEWKAHRKTARNASEAPIIMGASKHITRTAFLDRKVTGTEQEFTDWFEKNVLERGHEVEALARPIAENMLEEELFPVSGTSDDGYLSASLDGATMLGDRIWECKQWNEKKAADVQAGKVPDCDVWQVIHQLVVSGAKECLYMVTDGTPENTVSIWRSLEEGEEKTLRAAWAQFDLDAESHQPREPEYIPAGKAPESLPALHIEVTGMVTASNLNEFKSQALAVIGGINKDLQSDEDFADAEKTVKWLGEVESRLESAKEHALSQTASIDQLFKAVDDIKENARRTRLDLNKLVTARKEARRNEIRQAGVDAYRAHIDSLNARLGRVRLPDVPADFAGVMKGKKTIASLSDAVSVELARVKIESNQLADDYAKNLATIDEEGKGYEFLFSDLADLVTINPTHLAGVIQGRIAKHQAEEKRKEDEQRERIRKEEQAKAEIEAQQKLAADRANDPTPKAEQQDHFPDAKKMVDQEKPRVRQHSAPTKTRPTDQEIIGTLSLAYRVHESKVLEWLLDMDLSDAEEKLAANF